MPMTETMDERGKDVADGLRQNDKAHRLAGREAHAARSLGLAVVDGLNARADDLCDVRAAVHAHGDNAGGKAREVGDPRDIGDFHADHGKTVEDEHQLHHQRRAADELDVRHRQPL